jgi:hypothetical protein
MLEFVRLAVAVAIRWGWGATPDGRGGDLAGLGRDPCPDGASRPHGRRAKRGQSKT